MTDIQKLRKIEKSLANVRMTLRLLKSQEATLIQLQKELSEEVYSKEESPLAQVPFKDNPGALSTRTTNILRSMDIMDISPREFIQNFSKSFFLKHRNAGRKSLSELNDYFISLGLRW